jgi:hypothetical protein
MAGAPGADEGDEGPRSSYDLGSAGLAPMFDWYTTRSDLRNFPREAIITGNNRMDSPQLPDAP